jgi:VIT1/CCC1 family predicted Fe2+/Mn2+ transporter
MSQEPMTKSRQAASRGRWPNWARRGLMENVAIALILIGVFMLVQPFSITLYGWSFVTVLAGVVMFTVVSKFPE